MATTHWHTTIERTVTGLDYELVDVERSAAGLLRVFIDRIPGRSYPTGEAESVTVEDCERVTRQLQYVLEVEAVAYERLEVSSPGLDRPLKRPADYERFAGHEVNVTLKLPFKGRKNYRGLLMARAARAGVWRCAGDQGRAGAGLPARRSARGAAGAGARFQGPGTQRCPARSRRQTRAAG